MSERGYGRLGLRDGLPTFEQLIARPDHDKHVFLEIRPAVLIDEWSLESGSTYVAQVNTSYGGIVRDVVGVRTRLDQGLVRVSSLALCQATAGTFFCDVDEELLPAFRWDVDSWFESPTRYFDQFTKLYIHLEDSSNPNATVVRVEYSFTLGAVAQRHPTLGPDILTDGAFENWASATNLTSWSEVTSGNGSVDRVDSIANAGVYAVSLSGNYSYIWQALSVTAGERYRLAGVYQTPAIDPQGLGGILQVYDTATALTVGPDGRTLGAIPGGRTYLAPVPDNGVRRFSFDFVAPATATCRLYLLMGDEDGTIVLDNVTLQHISRFETYEGRLSAASLPNLTAGSSRIVPGQSQVGSASVSFAATDGAYDKAFSDLAWLNAEVRAYIGGEVDGRPVLADEWEPAFVGVVRNLAWDDSIAKLTLQDYRARLHVKLPLRKYASNDTPDMDPLAEGNPRPYAFGSVSDVQPWRIDFESTYSKYGVYELADCDTAPNGIFAVNSVYAWLSSTAVSDNDTSQRLTLTLTDDYTVDLATGQVTIVRDVGPYVVTIENNKLDITGPLVATITAGLYTAEDLAAEVQTQLNSVSSAWTCSYSETTNKFTLNHASLSVLAKTGANKEITILRLLGFSLDADLSGSNDSNEATFDDADSDHLITADFDGFKDDAAGSHTGSASSLIEIGPDWAHVIWVKWMSRPAASVDPATLASARATPSAIHPLGLYLAEEITTKDLFAMIEDSTLSWIVIGGDGGLYYVALSDTVDSSATELEEADLLEGSFAIDQQVADVSRGVRIRYAGESSRAWLTREVVDEDTGHLYGQESIEEVDTLVTTSGAAIDIAAKRAELRTALRRFAFATGSKLIAVKPGGHVRLTRSRAISSTGTLSRQAARVIETKKNILSGVVAAVAVEMEG